jgi:RimJ/RimL family protein N-acetyltransferase
MIPPASSEHVAANLDLETAELCIRPCDADSAARIVHIAADPLVGEPYRVGRARLAGAHAQASGWQHLPDDLAMKGRLSLAVHRRGGDVIGGMQFHGRQLSYLLARCVWRQGLGREMVEAACLHYPALLRLTCVQATVIRENVASRRVLERTGFVFGGLESRRWAGGQGMITMLRYQRDATPRAS